MRKWLLICFLICISAGCKKNVDVLTAPDPGKSSLLFPAQNAACTTGTVISISQTAITFNWTNDINADSYDLNIKNLLTMAATQQTVTGTQAIVTLAANTPYSWFIVSKSSKTSVTAQSDTWKFYIAGQGVLSHPPFPADGLKPGFGQTITASAGNLNLSWTGTDPDNDIVSYDVYYGTSSSPALLKANITDAFLNGVVAAPGATYYWKIITKDAQGNTSDSGIFQFKVN